MTSPAQFLAAVCAVCAACAPFALAEDAPPDDILRFQNGDLLHGRFDGIKEGPVILWNREDAASPLELRLPQLRQIVFHGGKTLIPCTSASNVTLSNDDKIPGDIISLDDKSLTLATTFAGEIHIPRANITCIAPNPFGGKLIYNGPFSTDGWEVIETRNPRQDANPAQGLDPDRADAEAADPKDKDKDKDKAVAPWTFSGAAWHDHGKNGVLLRKDEMPDRAILRFHANWRSNRATLSCAFHADLAKPAKKDKENARAIEMSGMFSNSRLFGNSYVIQLFSNYVMLFRSGYSADGKPYFERVQANNSNLHLPDTGDADFEIRCDRKTGAIHLFVDNQFAVQWNEPAGDAYAGHGGSFGFQIPSQGSGTTISNVIVTEWNGMPDSARSMESDSQDILLLANGIERFSGNASSIANGKVSLRGKYGEYLVPLADCAELHLTKGNVKPVQNPDKNPARIIILPVGRISGTLLPSPPHTVTLSSPVAGKLTVPTDRAALLQLQPTEHFLDDLDPSF